MDYVIDPPATIALPIRDDERWFPIHRIYCVGRNYAAHAVEMGGDPDQEPPFFFQKSPDTLVLDGHFPYPSATRDVHHEIELAVALGEGGEDIPVDRALEHVFGYATALDMTRRDLQGEAKKLGRPWEIAKAFEHAAPCSEVVPAALIGHPATGAISLLVNGEVRQSGDLAQMIWKVPQIIGTLSTLFHLRPGDLILTGTPAGVGPVTRGDHLYGLIEGVAGLEVEVV